MCRFPARQPLAQDRINRTKAHQDNGRWLNNLDLDVQKLYALLDKVRVAKRGAWVLGSNGAENRFKQILRDLFEGFVRVS